MARTKKATKVVDTTEKTVTFDFGAGSTFTAKLADMPEAIVTRLALHGIAQKLGDTYAGDVADPEHEVRAMFADLAAGNWSTRTPGEPKTGLLVEALIKMKKIEAKDGKTAAERVQAWLEEIEAKTEGAIKALRNDPTVKAEIATLQAQKARAAAKGVDANALLGSLE